VSARQTLHSPFPFAVIPAKRTPDLFRGTREPGPISRWRAKWVPALRRADARGSAGMTGHFEFAHQTRIRPDTGFTLLEIVVALAILGLSLTVLFGIFSQSVARTRINETRAAERALANSLLMRATAADAVATDSAGKTDSGLVWHIRFAPYGDRDDAKNWPQGVSEVTVTVARADAANPSSITLRTLKLVPKEPAP
jgi:general secretion pathway protein I